MKKLDRELLLKALNAVKPALGKPGGMMPAWGHLWFDGKYVYAYNGGLGIRYPLETDLDLGLPGETLLKQLGTTAVKEVTLEPGKQTVQLTMGRSRLQLAWLPPAQRMWPFEQKSSKAALTLTAPLLEAFNKLTFVKTSDPTEAVHYGITVFPSDKALELFATDGKTLASVVLPEPPVKELPDFIAPFPFIKQLHDLGKPGNIVYVTDCLLLVGDNGLLVGSNLQEFPERPNLPEIIEEHASDAQLPVPVELKLVLERAGIFANGDAGIKIAVAKDKLTLSGEYSTGALHEDLPITGKAPAASGTFLADRVLRGLLHGERFSLSKKAMVLYGADDFIYIVAAHTGK